MRQTIILFIIIFFTSVVSCSGFGGLDRALCLTMTCSASPIFESLYFSLNLVCVFNDGVFDTIKGISAGFSLARLSA